MVSRKGSSNVPNDQDNSDWLQLDADNGGGIQCVTRHISKLEHKCSPPPHPYNGDSGGLTLSKDDDDGNGNRHRDGKGGGGTMQASEPQGRQLDYVMLEKITRTRNLLLVCP
ncbi:hypothetical protein Acr_29g0010540 [Actinidia rufa]|uniref:Uncharacterized protein n=1 Tax=Actinidia rufa TaxID=165716 RepID=A0A7J0HFP9_9ERIC|nr:hypothetical protein Acr_29g0010540 [Actinidia rufa]